MKLNEILSGKTEFNIAFIGGSITEGFGASVPSKRYTSKFTEMISKRRPDIKFNEINAGRSGTPSGFGMFRLKHDVLNYKPDILFVEFAVNDVKFADLNLKCLEGLVRAARRWNSKLPIVFLFAYMEEILNSTREAPIYVVREQIKIANAYGIPYVHMGYDLYNKMKDFYDNADNGDVNNIFTVDGGHPNDDGYSTYSDSIMRDVFRADFSFEFPEKPLYGVEYVDPDMHLCENAPIPDGWTLSTRNIENFDVKYIYSDTVGASITFEFTGTEFGLLLQSDKGGGMTDIILDGKNMGKLRFHNCSNFQHIYDLLPFGKHTVTLIVSDQKDEDSEGHTVRIGAFLAG